MNDCIFCKIVKGEISSTKVYEDELVLAFLDIYPKSLGHTLIIPKKHFTNLYDIELKYLNKINEVSKNLAAEYKNKYNADGFNIIQSNEKTAEQDIMHYHMHLLPRYKEDNIKIWK